MFIAGRWRVRQRRERGSAGGEGRGAAPARCGAVDGGDRQGGEDAGSAWGRAPAVDDTVDPAAVVLPVVSGAGKVARRQSQSA